MTWDLQRFDIYRKIPKDLTQPTRSGAIISILSVTFIVFLLISEFIAFITPSINTSIIVDDPKKTSVTIPIKLKISVYNISCDYLGMDIQDDLGRHEVDFKRFKTKREINNGKGCYLAFDFRVNKVAGNFHVSTHGSDAQPKVLDLSHTVHELRIGDYAPPKVYDRHLSETARPSFTPLNGKTFISKEVTEVYDHYLKIVPSVYSQRRSNKLIYPYQFTVFNRVLNTRTMEIGAAIWFRYDMVPITVLYKEKYEPFYHFLTYMCGIIGGTFTVAGIIDSLVFSATQIYQKAAMDKLG